MRAEQWAVLGVVAGALLGGFAQVVAGIVEDRLTRQRAGREVRRDVYESFMRTTEAYYRELVGAEVARMKHERAQESWEALTAVGEVMMAAFTPLALHAPATVQKAALDLAAILHEMAHRSGRPEAFGSDAGVVPQFRHALLTAMREDLGVKDALSPTVSQVPILGPYDDGVANLYDYSPLNLNGDDDHPTCSG